MMYIAGFVWRRVWRDVSGLEVAGWGWLEEKLVTSVFVSRMEVPEISRTPCGIPGGDGAARDRIGLGVENERT